MTPSYLPEWAQWDQPRVIQEWVGTQHATRKLIKTQSKMQVNYKMSKEEKPLMGNNRSDKLVFKLTITLPSTLKRQQF